jgi:hypothetical protein
VSVYEAAQNAQRALYALEDALDRRIGHVGPPREREELARVVLRWNHDTLRKINRQLDASPKAEAS